MTLPSDPLETVAQRKTDLRDVLGSLAIENQTLDAASLRVWDRWVRGSITLDQLGSLFDDVIYARHPEARIDPPVPLKRKPSQRSNGLALIDAAECAGDVQCSDGGCVLMRDRLFLPETISEALDTNLATGLRAIADALDGGHLDGKHLGTIAAAGGSRDDRIHLRVTLDLAAPILQRDNDEGVEPGRLLARKQLLEAVEAHDRLRSLSVHGLDERAAFDTVTSNGSESELEK